MGKAIPSQHPAVVLRSSYTLVRALLAVAMVAVIGLTIAVVILATDGDEISSSSSAGAAEAIRYGGFNPATGRPESAPLPQREAQGQSTTRYDGGPEEGSRGVAPPPSSIAAADAAKYERLRSPGTRYDGGPEEGSRGSGH
jgi:hypothetical protein